MTEEDIMDEIDWKLIPKRRPTIRDFGRLYVTYVTEDKTFKDEPRVYESESITKF